MEANQNEPVKGNGDIIGISTISLYKARFFSSFIVFFILYNFAESVRLFYSPNCRKELF